MMAVDPRDEPLDFAYGSFPPGTVLELPMPVKLRLEARARAGGFLTPGGDPDPVAMMDAHLLDVGGAQLSIGLVHDVIYDAADCDLGTLLREVVRRVLVRDGFPEAAAKL